jgi:hypothetical protein
LAVSQIVPRGFEPLDEKQQIIVNKELTENANSNLCASLCNPLQKDTQNAPASPAENQPATEPELQQIITAWPELPEHIKAKIKALIETSKTE